MQVIKHNSRHHSAFPIIAFAVSIWLLALLFLLRQPANALTSEPTCTQQIGTWQSGAMAPSYHHEGAVGLINGKMYIIGGFAAYENNQLLATDRIDVYDVLNDTWETATTPRNPAPMVNSHMQGAVDGQYIWMAGGFKLDGNGDADDGVRRYDTVNDTWLTSSDPNSIIPPLPEPRASGAFVRAGRNLHYFGGVETDRQTVTNNHWILNIDNPTEWIEGPALPRARNHFQGVYMDGVIYLFGGQVGHDQQGNFDVSWVDAYDVNTGTWSTKASMPQARSHAEATTFIANGRVIVMAGRENTTKATSRKIVEYNPETDSWAEIGNLPDWLLAPIGAVVGDRIFVTNGGEGWNQPSNRTWFAEVTDDCIEDYIPVANNDEYIVSDDTSTVISPQFGPLMNDYDPDNRTLTIDSVGATTNGGTMTLNPDGSLEYTPSAAAQSAGQDQFTYTMTDSVFTQQASITLRMRDPLNNTGQWINYSTNNQPTARHENAFVESGGKFYLFAGRGQKPLQVFDPQTRNWSWRSNPPMELHHIQAVSLNNLIYIVGAYTGYYPNERAIANVYIYDPITDTWMVGPEIPEERRRASAGVVVREGKIYLVGGLNNGHGDHATASKMFDVYDPATNTWTALPDAIHARDHFHAAIIGDKLYAAGGRDTGTSNFFNATIAAVDVYDFNTGTWSIVPNPLPTPRGGSMIAAIDEYLIVIGGEGNGQAYDNAEALDTTTNTWVTLDSLNRARHGSQVAVCNDTAYVVAGSGNQGGAPELTHFEVFSFTVPQTCPQITPQPGSVQSDLSVDFGLLQENQTADDTITLTNNSPNQGLVISEITAFGEHFDVDVPYTLPIVLPPGASMDVTAKYVPSTYGNHGGSINVKYGANGNNHSILLIGEVEVPPLPPVAEDDSYETDYETVLNIAADGMLNNDSDPNKEDTISAVQLTDVATIEGGQVMLDANGSFVYTPPEGFSGDDSFSYQASDGTHTSDPAVVTITVGPNPPPTASDDTVTYTESYPNAQTFSDSVLDNDNDPNGDDIEAVDAGEALNGGIVVLNIDGTFTYTPSDASATAGTDEFTYRVTDGTSESETATVTINGIPNPSPEAADDEYEAAHETTLLVDAPGLLSNDSDPNEDTLMAVAVEDMATTQGGSVKINANGSFEYTPADDFSGEDSFIYQNTDGNTSSDGATVTITVSENPGPIPAADDYVAQYQTTLESAAPGVLGNDSDPNDDPIEALTQDAAATTEGGTVTLNTDGSFSYTPPSKFSGQDSFTYQITDGNSESAPVTVTIDVQNTAPTATADSYALDADTVLTVSAENGLLSNDSDPDGDDLTATLISGVSNGILMLNPDGSFTYEPAADYSGADSFQYAATDGNLESAAVTVELQIAAPPTPTETATEEPTPTATASPTAEPTAEPTESSTPDPTAEPTAEPTTEPTDEPTTEPTEEPVVTVEPTVTPAQTWIEGELNRDIVRPIFKWSVAHGANGHFTFASWYGLEVRGDNNNLVLEEWVEVTQVCQVTTGICSYTPSGVDLPVGFTNGTYSWVILTWDGTNVNQLAQNQFTVNVPAATVPTDTMIDTSSGRPVVVFPNDPGISWLNLYFGTPDFSQTINYQWYAKADAVCDDNTCRLYPNAHPTNGDYVAYIQTWGPGGYSNGDSSYWAGPFGFSLNAPAAEAVISGQVTVNGSSLSLNWTTPANTTWYQVWVGTGDYSATLHTGWVSAVDLGCAESCTLTLDDLGLASGQRYEWWIKTWGPGGGTDWQMGSEFTP